MDLTKWNFGGADDGKTIIRFFGENPGFLALAKDEVEDFIKDLTFYSTSGEMLPPRQTLAG